MIQTLTTDIDEADICECCYAEEGVTDGLCIDCRAEDAEYLDNLDALY